jgi:hypothetical protein
VTVSESRADVELAGFCVCGSVSDHKKAPRGEPDGIIGEE